MVLLNKEKSEEIMKLDKTEKNDKSFEYKYLLKRMFPYIKPYLGRAIIGTLLAIPVGLLDGVVAFALKPYMDEVIVNKNIQFATYIPILIVVFAVIQGILKYLNVYFTSWAGGKLTNKLRIALYEKLLCMSTSFYNANSSGIIFSRYWQDANLAMVGIIGNTKLITSTICSSLALIFVLIYNSWKLAAVAVLVLGFAMLPMALIRKKIRDLSNKTMKLNSKVVTHFNESFAGNKIISSFNLKTLKTEQFQEKMYTVFNLAMSLTKVTGWLSPIMYLIASTGIAFVMWYGNHLIISGQITSGSFASFITALLLLYKPIKSFGNVLAGMQNSFVAMNRVVKVLDIESEIKEIDNAIEFHSVNEGITIEDIHFGYEKNQNIIKGISVEIKKGETLALVGNSGGGKSTLANLIPRFYDVREGAIKIDGENIKNLKIESIRENISVVFQDNFLFGGTIKENILLGKMDATDEEIQKAIKDSYLEEFIASLPDGIDSQIGELGSKLSGGQKQRIAIARAMIKDAPILILDEATSALDNKSEAIVQKALEKLMKNRTVIVIAHRLSTIQNANKIAVIDDGKLIELGNHQELLQKAQGVYQSLYNAQFKRQEVPA